MTDTITGDFGAVLGIRAQRLEMLASNIANAATPNYKARDLDFGALGQACLQKRREDFGSAFDEQSPNAARCQHIERFDQRDAPVGVG